MSDATKQQVQTSIREVLKQAAVDPEFRQLALRDSRAAYFKATNQQLPKDYNIQFIDNYGKSTKTVVLPDPISNGDRLSEEQLEQVSGGCIVTTCDAGSCVNTGTVQ